MRMRVQMRVQAGVRMAMLFRPHCQSPHALATQRPSSGSSRSAVMVDFVISHITGRSPTRILDRLIIALLTVRPMSGG